MKNNKTKDKGAITHALNRENDAAISKKVLALLKTTNGA
jgi:hypothetical protein